MEKPLLSFCTPVHNDGPYVGAMIQSILDQDYPNIEHILVNDGSKDSTKEVLNEYAAKYNNRIKVIHLETNQGACVARNEAAQHASGKYLSFLPADARLFPGMARYWVEQLEENPGYDFVYGGYTFTDEQRKRVLDFMPSHDFDPYMLEVQNFIDGSFPLTRTLYDKIGGWDITVKSLQDWDFWLTAVKDIGAKGVFCQELFFDTVLPHPGGLSFDSANNWLARTDYIKAKHKIPERDICVCSFGAPFHGINTAKMLNADFKEMPSGKPHRYKMIYIVGGYYSNFQYIVEALKKHDGMRVLHWIGSDIYQLLELKNSPLPTAKMALSYFLEYLANNIDVHLVEFEVTKKELQQFGIKAKMVPLPPARLYDPQPLPEQFTVAVYLPEVNRNFYYPDVCMELAQQMPMVFWKIFGNAKLVGKKENIEHVGYVKPEMMPKFIADCSAILRLTPHDGLPLSVAEFIMAARNAVTSTPMPYIVLPRNLEISTLVEAVTACQKMGPNLAGSAHYRQLLDHEKFNKKIHGLMKYDPKKYWNDRARSWNVIKGTQLSEYRQEDFTRIIEKYLKKVEAKSILDLGCGNGTWYPWLAKRCEKYLGIDISKKLTDLARKNHPEGRFIDGALSELAFITRNFYHGERFDVAFSFTTLLHVPPDQFTAVMLQIAQKARYGIFIEPVIKPQREAIVDRKLHPELIRDIFGKGLILQGVESSFIHHYQEKLPILEFENIEPRHVMLVDLDAYQAKHGKAQGP